MKDFDERALASTVLALGIFVGLFFPTLTHLAEPLMMPALFALVILSTVPFAPRADMRIFALSPRVWQLAIWQQIMLPILALIVGINLQVSDDVMMFMLVSTTAGSLFASPAIIQILDLNERDGFRGVVISTLFTPISLYAFMQIASMMSASSFGELSLDLMDYGARIGVFFIFPTLFLIGYKKYSANLATSKRVKIEQFSRWGAIIALLVFGLAILDAVTYRLEDDPMLVLKYLAIAIAVGCCMAVSTAIFMAHHGQRTALTGSVLAGFRNVGLSLGLLSSVASEELAVYVGISQIPAFIAPLLIDILFPRWKRDLKRQGQKLSQDTANAEQFSSNSQSTYAQPKMSEAISASVTNLHGISTHFSAPTKGLPTSQLQDDSPSGLATANPTSGEFLTMGSSALSDPQPQENIDYSYDPTASDAALDKLREQNEHARREYDRLKSEDASWKPHKHYLISFAVVFLLGCIAVWKGNEFVAPTLYNIDKLNEIAAAHVEGKNYGVYDLNINIRDLRDQHLSLMKETPDIGILGASHWQEAHVNLIPYKNFYNSHVHRDYWEDMLAMVHLYEKHDKLPKQLIMVIRDNLFWPIKTRPDHLWLPGIKHYRPMAKKLGLAPQNYWDTMPVQTWKELISLPFLKINASRHFGPGTVPHKTDKRNFDDLDVLLPGGSILWSNEHRAFFDRGTRAHDVSAEFAEFKKKNPPQVSQRGVENVDRLLGYLKSKGVEVYLAHPPFNPVFWDAVQGSSYIPAMQRIEQITKDYSAKYDFPIVGSFNPYKLGCKATDYIDAEHSSPRCLQKFFQQFALKDSQSPLRGTIKN